MARIRFDFGALTLDAELLDTPTAKAIAAALPLSSSVLTWGEEVYFDVPVDVAREPDARAVIVPGEIAYWPQGPGHRHRLWPHADLQGQRDAARQPLQRVRQGARQREDAGQGEDRQQGRGDGGPVASTSVVGRSDPTHPLLGKTMAATTRKPTALRQTRPREKEPSEDKLSGGTARRRRATGKSRRGEARSR